jgi:hypothetical protein
LNLGAAEKHPIIPTATYDDGAIYIYSSIDLSDCLITVSDAAGNIIYTDTISLSADSSYSFSLNCPQGTECEIEIEYGDTCLSGSFTAYP